MPGLKCRWPCAPRRNCHKPRIRNFTWREQAAALWRCLESGSPDFGAAGSSLRKLETELTQFRARARNQAATAELQRQVQEMEADRLPSWMVYGLGGALAVALGLCGWLWRRSDRAASKSERSWREAVAVSSRRADEPSVVDLETVERWLHRLQTAGVVL